MKVTRVLAVMLMLLLAVGLVVGCSSSTTTTTAASTGTTAATSGTTATTAPAAPVTLKIGGAGPFTGNLAKIGTDALQAVQMAVDDFNASGAMPGVTFTVDVGDDAADPAKAATVAQKFASDDVRRRRRGPDDQRRGAVRPADPQRRQPGRDHPVGHQRNALDARLHGLPPHLPERRVQGPAIAKFMIEDLKVKNAFIIDDKRRLREGSGRPGRTGAQGRWRDRHRARSRSPPTTRTSPPS